MMKTVVWALVMLGLSIETTQSAREIPGFTYLGSSVGGKGLAIGNYYLSQAMGTWDIAESTCGSLGTAGSKLLSIEDQQEDLHVKSLMITAGIYSTWTSGYLQTNILRWYSTGQRGYYTNWRNNVQPSSVSTESVYIRANGARDYYWSTYSNSVMLQYICETPAD